MKSVRKQGEDKWLKVAPFVGAWIEIFVTQAYRKAGVNVAPFVGAWIEIDFANDKIKNAEVAPFVGAWIEIYTLLHLCIKMICRSLRGSVD